MITVIYVKSVTIYCCIRCSGADGSFLHLWTINARAVWKTTTESKIKCIDFSCAPEGVSVNIVAAGLENGIIRYFLVGMLNEVICLRGNRQMQSFLGAFKDCFPHLKNVLLRLN